MSGETCSVYDCCKPVLEQGLCMKHLANSLVRGGRRHAKMRSNKGPYIALPGKPMEWIQAHRAYEGDDCLIFPYQNGRRYPTVVWLGQKMAAHRLMCRLAHGLPPEDKPLALHTCGNGEIGCMNQNHLYWGDASDNAKDAWRHRREGKPGARRETTRGLRYRRWLKSRMRGWQQPIKPSA